VQLLLKHGWIKVTPGGDHRERWLSLSAAGEAELGRVNALWETAQSDMKRRLGNERWSQLLALSLEIAKMSAVPE
jgi:DNA-binding PadR family transcriptional regulator